MNVTRVVITALLALLLLSTGGGKLAGAESSHAIRDSLHVPPGRWRAIGAAEILLVAGLVAGIWLVPVGIAAAAGVLALMVGAIVTRRAAGGPGQRSGIIADLVVLVSALAAAVLGLATA